MGAAIWALHSLSETVEDGDRRQCRSQRAGFQIIVWNSERGVQPPRSDSKFIQTLSEIQELIEDPGKFGISATCLLQLGNLNQISIIYSRVLREVIQLAGVK